jgi:hypothetical protein
MCAIIVVTFYKPGLNLLVRPPKFLWMTFALLLLMDFIEIFAGMEWRRR